MKFDVFCRWKLYADFPRRGRLIARQMPQIHIPL
jgi:hypothetical protein